MPTLRRRCGAIKAGAEDFLTKPVSSEQLLRTIEQAMAHHYASRGRKQKLDALRDLLGTLTSRERQVFERVVLGKINKQIAHELGTTERTIKAHRQQVMEKMKVQTLVELVSIAERLGIVVGNAGETGARFEPAQIAGIVLQDNWNAALRDLILEQGHILAIGLQQSEAGRFDLAQGSIWAAARQWMLRRHKRTSDLVETETCLCGRRRPGHAERDQATSSGARLR